MLIPLLYMCDPMQRSGSWRFPYKPMDICVHLTGSRPFPRLNSCSDGTNFDISAFFTVHGIESNALFTRDHAISHYSIHVLLTLIF